MAVNITPKKRINHDDDKCNRMFGVLAKMVIVEILSYHGLLIPESHLFEATLDWRLDFSHPDSQLWWEVHSELMQRISGHNNQWYEQWTCWKQSFFSGKEYGRLWFMATSSVSCLEINPSGCKNIPQLKISTTWSISTEHLFGEDHGLERANFASHTLWRRSSVCLA